MLIKFCHSPTRSCLEDHLISTSWKNTRHLTWDLFLQKVGEDYEKLFNLGKTIERKKYFTFWNKQGVLQPKVGYGLWRNVLKEREKFHHLEKAFSSTPNLHRPSQNSCLIKNPLISNSKPTTSMFGQASKMNLFWKLLFF